MTNHEGPTVRVLWDKTQRARRPYICGCCNAHIEVGAVYESRGYIEDGEFKTEKTHRWAYRYPSGCPRFMQRDKAEAAEQFEKDYQ